MVDWLSTYPLNLLIAHTIVKASFPLVEWFCSEEESKSLAYSIGSYSFVLLGQYYSRG